MAQTIRRAIILSLLSASTLLIQWTGNVQASVVSGFMNITANNTFNALTGEQQIQLALVDLGGGQIRWDFSNNGPTDSVVKQIFFDIREEAGLAPAGISPGNTPTAQFKQDNKPGNLPGGNIFDFETTLSLSALSPAPKNGIGTGETFSIVMQFTTGHSFQTLSEAFSSGDLRVGVHAISFPDGGSESFIASPVPAPASLLLFANGIAFLLGAKRLFGTQAPS